MTDIPRTGYARRKKIRRVLIGSLLLSGLGAAGWGVSRLEPAPPMIDRASVWLGEIERGTLAIEVRGPGTLVPEEIRWVSAPTSGRVEEILLLPGSEVAADSILMRLDNPELESEALNAELQLRQAMAELQDLRVELEGMALAQEAQAASVGADYQEYRLQADLNKKLAEEGLISDLQLRLSEVTADELAKRNTIEQKRLSIAGESARARIDAKEAQISQLRGLLELRQRQVRTLKVRAGIAGVLQQTPVEVGRQVATGEILGKVAVPGRLKAELLIPETQAKDVRVGLTASIDTRNGVISGRVVRIDPAAEQGTVRVDVALEGDMPPGARPDLNVDGTIEINRMEDVLKMSRPAHSQPNSSTFLFKLTEDGRQAERIEVNFGRASVTRIQILAGLDAGDRVILSDTSAWDRYKRIRLE